MSWAASAEAAAAGVGGVAMGWIGGSQGSSCCCCYWQRKGAAARVKAEAVSDADTGSPNCDSDATAAAAVGAAGWMMRWMIANWEQLLSESTLKPGSMRSTRDWCNNWRDL